MRRVRHSLTRVALGLLATAAIQPVFAQDPSPQSVPTLAVPPPPPEPGLSPQSSPQSQIGGASSGQSGPGMQNVAPGMGGQGTPEGATGPPGAGVGMSTNLSASGSAPSAAGGPGAPGGPAGGSPNLFAGGGGDTGATNTLANPVSYFAMLGDMSPSFAHFSVRQKPPSIVPTYQRSSFAPSVRGFKISENQSPVPQDRVFFSMNAYQDVNAKLDRDFEAPFKKVQIYNYNWGFEKTFNNGMGSFGLLLPLNNITSQPTAKLLNTAGTSTAPGNLTLFLKHVFYVDLPTGSLVSGGLAISPQTAATNFAGAKYLRANNTTTIQPYFAYLFNIDRFYIHGFNSIDVPYDYNQPTMLYNDIGVGYFLFRNEDKNGFISAIAPTFEAHANIPLNHRDPFNRLDNFGSPDIVNLTSGLNVAFRKTSVLTFGVSAPVTGPRPFSLESQILLNVYFGRTRRQASRSLPMIGG